MAIKVGTPQELGIKSEEVSSFYRDAWSRPIALGDDTFYRWQFVDVPFQEGLDSCCVAVEGGKVVGVMGVNARDFFMESNCYRGAELTTWIVSASHRNKGIGPKIISYLQTKYEVLLGMGITDDALSVYLRYGFRYLRAIPRFVKVLDWNVAETYGKVTPLAKKISKYYEKHALPTVYRVDNIELSKVEEIYQVFKKQSHLFSREKRYFTWRYTEHPSFAYDTKIVLASEAQGKGVVVVLRLEKSAEEIKILHVIDCFGDIADMPAALSYIDACAKEHDAAVVDFFSTHSQVNSYFLKAGWFSTLDDQFLKFPHLFQPLELREPATTSLIYWAKEMGMLCELGKLYVTKEDCDFDRPVLG